MVRDVPVREVMDREFVAASPSDDLLATVELMLREEAEPAVVLQGSELVGVLGDRDVIAKLVSGEDDRESATVREAMTESTPTVGPEETLDEARDRMAAWSTHWLVVTEGDEPQGVITEHDVLTSSTLGSEVDATEEPLEQEQVVGAGSAAAAAEGTAQEGGFEEQAICERCGSLSHDVAAINGQLLCGDCRDV